MLASIKFEFRKKANKNGLRPIYMRVSYMSKRIEIATGIKVPQSNWDQNKQKFKKTSSDSIVNQIAIESMKDKVNRFIILNQGISIDDMFSGIRELFYAKKSNELTFHEVYEKYLNQLQVSYTTTQKYNTTYTKFIKGFEKECLKSTITFSKLDLEFFDKFKQYLFDHGMNDNSASKRLSNFFTFLEWSTKREYNANLKYRIVEKIPSYQPDTFALTQQELDLLISSDLSEYPILEKSRDIFIFQIFTGQRVGDVMDIQYNQIFNDKWQIRQKKEDKFPVTIPLTSLCLKILKKYNGSDKPLPVKSHQKYNEDLKKIAKKIGLNRIIIRFFKSGNKDIVLENPIYEIISSHTARRTNVTISLELDISKEIGMFVTNHKKSIMYDSYNKMNLPRASMLYTSAWDSRFK